MIHQHTYAKVAGQPQRANVGWTTPATIYEKMRQVNASALALNGDIAANVQRAAFKQSWASWFDAWQKFFAKYQGTGAKLGALTYTDELYQQVLSYESQLVSWYDAYGRETNGGQPLPAPSSPPPQPNVPIPPSRGPDLPEAPDASGLHIPWWGWLLGGLAIAGAGYATYLYVQKARRIKAVLDERVVPAALNMYGGPMGGTFSSAYTASRDPVTGQAVLVPAQPIMQVAASPPLPIPYARYPGQ